MNLDDFLPLSALQLGYCATNANSNQIKAVICNKRPKVINDSCTYKYIKLIATATVETLQFCRAHHYNTCYLLHLIRIVNIKKIKITKVNGDT